MKKQIILLFLCIPLVSCQSAGRGEQLTRNIEMAPGESSGIVGTVTLENGILTLPGKNISIACLPDSSYVKSKIEESDRYNYTDFFRPDGPVKTLLLEKGEMMTAWIGDGIRSGMGPEGLKIHPGKDEKSLILQSESDVWTVYSDNETSINWNGDEWLVFVSSILMGTLQDQPAFSADIVILRK